MTPNKHILSDYQFYNLPKYFLESDYLELCDLAVAELKKDPNILAVYLEGAKWVTGISDLDILVVYKNQTRGPYLLRGPWELSEKAKYIFIHNYGIYDESSFCDLYYLIPDITGQERPRLLWGKNIPIRNPQAELSPENYRYLNSIVIFDLLVNKLLLYANYIVSKKINVRRLLAELYSLIYTLKMAEVIGITENTSDFSARIDHLKKNWFNSDSANNFEELLSLLEIGIDIVLKITEGLDKFTTERSLPKNKNLIFKNRNFYVIFDEKWDRGKFLNGFKEGLLAIKNPLSGKVLENYKLILPAGLSYFLMAYAGFDGTFSQWFREKLVGRKERDNVLVPEGMMKHIAETNDFIQASIDNGGLFKIPFSYGFMVDRQTIISKIGEKIFIFLRKIKK